MAHFETHCQDCEKALGKRFEDVNHWIDALCEGDMSHRDIRHNLEGLELVRQLFGEEAVKAAKIHICRDWGIIESEIPKDEDAARLLRLAKKEEWLLKRLNKLGHVNPYPKD